MKVILVTRVSRPQTGHPLKPATLPVRLKLSFCFTFPAYAHLPTPRQALPEGHSVYVTARRSDSSHSRVATMIFLSNRKYLLHPYGLQGLRVGPIISPRRPFYNSLNVKDEFAIACNHFTTAWWRLAVVQLPFSPNRGVAGLR